MKIRLILPSLILLIFPIHAMKRSHSLKKENPVVVSDLAFVIEEILEHHIIEYPLAKKPKEATKMVNTFAQINKRFNTFINAPDNNNKITKNLAYNLYCSHETIAKKIQTKRSKEQLKLQYDLKKLCRSTYIFNRLGDRATLITEKFNELSTQHVDLDFTYNNQYNWQATPLMLATNNSNNTLFDLLLEAKADINSHTSHGSSLLKFLVAVFPIRPGYFDRYKKILKLPELKINQQNRRGETVLLRCLVSRKPGLITHRFITVIEELLEAGADPELANNRRLTPLVAAQQLKNERIINLIKLAIENKHSTS